MKKILLNVGIAVVVGGIALSSFIGNSNEGPHDVNTAMFNPNWAAISLWPNLESGADAQPDPQRLTTVIILDDSGSMSSDIAAAKIAVAEAVNQLPDNGRVALTALNRGVLMKPTPVVQARSEVKNVLRRVNADGGTPLGKAMATAHDILMGEAARQRGFGTYRAIVTTDGEASDPAELEAQLQRILSDTPIEVVTIGIGIGEGHVLNLPGFVNYVAVNDVSGLSAALTDAVAEQTSFEPITSFEGAN